MNSTGSQLAPLPCTIQAVRFRDALSGYSVLGVSAEGYATQQTVVGHFAELRIGEKVRFQGTWTTHAKFGKQFQAQSAESIVPEQGDALVDFLASGLFPGIGPSVAAKIVAAFGESTLTTLDNNPGALLTIKGFGRKRLAGFESSWSEYRQSREILLYLAKLGVTGSAALRLWRILGPDSQQRIEENPYLLADDPCHLGFERADQIAMRIGIKRDAGVRLQAGILHTLSKATWSEGHVFLPQQELLTKAFRLLALDMHDEHAYEHLAMALENLVRNDRVIGHEGNCWQPALFRCEEDIGKWVQAALQGSTKASKHDCSKVLRQLASEAGVKYSEEQESCILGAAENAVYVLTGGPGTGKTTTLRGILALLDAAGEDTLLAAPTGRAAKRMSELCGREAKTLHRLLEIDAISGAFLRNEDKPLDAHRVIVDEASMLDAVMMRNLVRAMPRGCGLILIGDRDQLPSVGPGMILAELLACSNVPSGRLTRIFRQGEGSAIAKGAHRILRGLAPENDPSGGLHHHAHKSPEEAQLTLTNLAQQYGLQVLVPMHRPPLGTTNINRLLQLALNPDGEELNLGGTYFRVGDRVMQMRNNYDWNVFNGDIGVVRGFLPGAKKVVMEFDGRRITADFVDMEQISLAYACTIHKSQGSEYPRIAILLDESHGPMLQRNLVYTALTRAKEHAHILFTPGALEQAARNDRQARRYTRLRHVVQAGNEFMEWLKE